MRRVFCDWCSWGLLSFVRVGAASQEKLSEGGTQRDVFEQARQE